MTNETTPPQTVGSNLLLGPLPPQSAGQANMMEVSESEIGRDIEISAAEVGRWYSPAAVREMLAAERERWTARVEEAFRDGFYAPRTYNDTVLNTADEAWEEAKAGLLRA